MEVTVLSDGNSFGMDVKLDRNAHVRDLAGRMRTFRSGHRASVPQIRECVNNNYPQLIFLDSIPLGAYIPHIATEESMAMRSHELAAQLIATGQYLLSRPDFETPCTSHSLYLGSYWDDKERFIAAVRALGAGIKSYNGSDLQFNTKTPLEIWTRINRQSVCKKVQEEKWECEPLLTPDEDAAIGGDASTPPVPAPYEGNLVGGLMGAVDKVTDASVMTDDDIPF
jgi:hypothetical protein